MTYQGPGPLLLQIMSPVNQTPTASRDRKVDCRCGQPVESSVSAAHCPRCGRSLQLVAALVLAA